MSDFGDELRRLRTAHGVSLRALGRQVYVTHVHLVDLEHGRKRPSTQLAEARSTRPWRHGKLAALAATVAAGGALPDEALRSALEWLVTPTPQTEHLAAGRRVGTELAELAADRVHRLRLLDDRLGGTDTMALVERELQETGAVVREASYEEATGGRLLSVLSELHQLAGWVAMDAGRYDRAERHYLDGVQAARGGGDVPSAGNLLSCLAYLKATTGNRSDAVLLARAAVRGADPVPGRARVLMLDRLAFALARSGEDGETCRVLAEVEESISEPPHGDEPPGRTG